MDKNKLTDAALAPESVKRGVWHQHLPMPFMLACALLGPRYFIEGEMTYVEALGLGFACALVGGLLIKGLMALIYKLCSK